MSAGFGNRAIAAPLEQGHGAFGYRRQEAIPFHARLCNGEWSTDKVEASRFQPWQQAFKREQGVGHLHAKVFAQRGEEIEVETDVFSRGVDKVEWREGCLGADTQHAICLHLGKSVLGPGRAAEAGYGARDGGGAGERTKKPSLHC